MTIEQVDVLRLGIAPIDNRIVLIVESGLEWLKENTTLEFDINNDSELKALPASVRLFLTKFVDVNNLSVGVSSESIENLSQSFTQKSSESLIWQFAEQLLSPYLKSRVRFVAAENRWL